MIVGAQGARRMVVRACVPVYLMLIGGVPTVLVSWLVRLTTEPGLELALALLSPIVFVLAYVATAGLLSRLTLRGMVAGKFRRDLGHKVYGPRRLHALCWTSIYYFPPLYHAVLAIPSLRRLTFRLFGYRGALDATLYPDTWLRDLPLLQIGRGAYLSNRATIGTNMCLKDGRILVAPVRVGANAMVGHLAMLAPGVDLAEDVEVGVGCGIGLHVRVGRESRIGPMTTVNHGAVIGDQCEIGTMVLVGAKATIGDRVHIPAGTVVPPRAVLRDQDDVRALQPSRRSSRRSALATTVTRE